MGLQKYRADKSTAQPDGAVLWHAHWLGGPSLARVNSCRWESLHSSPRVTAYATGEPDSYFSIPAACHYAGRTIKGYLTTGNDGNVVFRHCYF
jgi:hypothetical protein